MKKKIVFFGSSKFVIPIIEVLQKNFDLTFVLTTERLVSQGLAWEAPVIKYCTENKIPYLSVAQFNNLTIQQLKKTNAPIGILADFGLIIPKNVLNLFPKGIINIHPSLLPKYRGPTPVQTAILEGVRTTGVSIIKLDSEIDHGPILTQEKEQILDNDTAESLYKRIFEKGANLLVKVLNKYLDGNLKPTAQIHKKATFTKPLTRQDGHIDVSNETTAVTRNDTNRMIRAYYPWPGVWTEIMIKGKLLRIKFLPEEKIQVEGKKPMSYKDFFNGYPEKQQIMDKLLGL